MRKLKHYTKYPLAGILILFLVNSVFGASPFTWNLLTPGDNDPVSVFPAIFRSQVRNQFATSGANGGILNTLAPTGTPTTGWRETQTTNDTFICQNTYNTSTGVNPTPTWNRDDSNTAAICITEEPSIKAVRVLANTTTGSNPITFTEWSRTDANGILLPEAKGINAEAANDLTLGYNALVSSSSTGFPYLPSICGPLTGTPTNISNFAPVVYDSCSGALSVYNGGTNQWFTFPNAGTILQTIANYVNTTSSSTSTTTTSFISNNNLSGPLTGALTNSTGIMLTTTGGTGSSTSTNAAIDWNSNVVALNGVIPAVSWQGQPDQTSWGGYTVAWPFTGGSGLQKPTVIGVQSGVGTSFTVFSTQAANTATALIVAACLSPSSFSGESFGGVFGGSITNRLAGPNGGLYTLIAAANNNGGALSQGTGYTFSTGNTNAQTHCNIAILYMAGAVFTQASSVSISFAEGTTGTETVPQGPLSGATSSCPCIALGVINNNTGGNEAHALTTTAVSAGWAQIGNQLSANAGVTNVQIDQAGWVNGSQQSTWQEAGNGLLTASTVTYTIPQTYGTAAIAICMDTTAAAAISCTATLVGPTNTTTQLLVTGTINHKFNWFTIGY